jgi:hypothetical protein
MQNKWVTYLYCVNTFLAIVFCAIFLLFRERNTASKMGIPLPALEGVLDYLMYLSVIFCLFVFFGSMIVFFFGNFYSRVGTVVPFLLSILYLALLINLYYTMV